MPAGNTALAEVAKYVNGGQAVWISSEKVTQDAAGKTLFTDGHAYMAYDADPGNPTNTSVQVFNPWGATSAASDAGYVAPFAADLAQIVASIKTLYQEIFAERSKVAAELGAYKALGRIVKALCAPLGDSQKVETTTKQDSSLIGVWNLHGARATQGLIRTSRTTGGCIRSWTTCPD